MIEVLERKIETYNEHPIAVFIWQIDLEGWLKHFRWKYTKSKDKYIFSLSRENFEDIEYEITLLFLHIGKKYNRNVNYIFITQLTFAFQITSEPYLLEGYTGLM